MSKMCIIAFYKFIKIVDIDVVKSQIEYICEKYGTKGTILIAPEGINGTIEGSEDNINNFLQEIKLNKNFIHLFYFMQLWLYLWD